MKGQRHYWAALFLFFLLMGSSGHSMAADPVLRTGIYIIQMSGSDMTAAATSEAAKSPMILWPYRPTATWEFRHLGNNVYTVRSNSTMLDAAGSRSGAAVTITRSHKGPSQQWKLKRVGQYYQFINVQTGQAMELGNGKRVKGSKLQSDTPTDSLDQLFCVQRPKAPRFCGNGSGRDDGNSYKGNDDNSNSYKGNTKSSKKGKTSTGDQHYGPGGEVNSFIRE